MTPIRTVLTTVLLLAGLIAAPAPARAETYNTCAGFITSVPATISTQGVWCLKNDLTTAITTGNAITIATNNVTIDCNDFKLGGLQAGAATQAYGIFANDRVNTTVRHCNIRGFQRGIRLTGGVSSHGHLIEDNRLETNTDRGIDVSGYSSVIRRNFVVNTGDSTVAVAGPIAIYAFDGTNIIDNIIDGVFAPASTGFGVTGIQATANGDPISIAGNRIAGLRRDGTGEVNGIQVSGTGTRTITGNIVDLATFAVQSYGVRCAYSGGQYAKDNFIIGFYYDIQTCTDAGGNVL